MKKFISILSICSVVAIIAMAAAPALDFGDFTGSNPYTATRVSIEDDAADTVNAIVADFHNSVTFTAYGYDSTGDPSSVTLKLYASATGTIDYNASPIFSVTMPNGDTTFQHVVTGNPYTDYSWIIDGGGNTHRSHYTLTILTR